MYRIELKAKKEYSIYTCSDGPPKDESLTPFSFTATNEPWSEADWSSGYDYYDYDYDYYDEYDYDYETYYKDRKDPCKDAFYTNLSISRNILISDFGIIAKAGADKSIHVVLTDLTTTEPISGATIKFYDFQQQVLGEATSNSEGMSVTHLDQKPFVLIVEKDGKKGYLKLKDGESLSLSKFDVSGETVQHGIKGFIYTERGVWRPGDSVYVSFMLEDKADLLPASHPVSFQLINPKGIVVDEQMATQ